MKTPHDDPTEIADYLIQQHGLDGALGVAMQKAASAPDNYDLSVWREVKSILKNKKTGPEGPASLTGRSPEGRR